MRNKGNYALYPHFLVMSNVTFTHDEPAIYPINCNDVGKINFHDCVIRKISIKINESVSSIE